MIRRPPRSTPLSLHDALPISVIGPFADMAQIGPNYTGMYSRFVKPLEGVKNKVGPETKVLYARGSGIRSEEHTSELQSQSNLVCRLLLEKKKKQQPNDMILRS